VQTVELELELEPDPVVALIVTWVELAVVFGVFTVTVPVSSPWSIVTLWSTLWF
jgi:hypothetical protein